MFALKWNPTQFKLDIHLQMYQETDGSLAYLKGHTVRKLVSLMKYMSLLIRQDRSTAQKHNPLYFISGNQLFKLTAHDMKSALVNDKLENHASQKYSSITEVWHMAHFWVSYGRCTMPGSPMGRSEGSSRRWTG